MAAPNVTAYSLLVIEPGAHAELIQALRADPHVLDAQDVMGAYDIVVEIHAPSLQDLHEFVFTRLRGLDGIRSTTTLIAQPNPA